MRRLALRILVFLMLGAIINVAVAWGFALWGRNRDRIEMPIGDADIQLWVRFAPPNAPQLPTMVTMSESAGRASRLITAISGRELPPVNRISQMTIFQFGEDSFGWPAYSLAWHYHDSADGPRYSYTLPRNPVLDIEYELGTAVPIRPLWPGFAINTVFYAFVLWLLFAGPFVLRRRRRIRRGLCPKCAYDLRGTPHDATACPECGAAVVNRSSSASR